MSRALDLGLLLPGNDVPVAGESLRFISGPPLVADWFPFAPLASPGLTGAPTAPTAAPGDTSTKLATTAFVQNAITSGTAGVASFNTRVGAVTLSNADIIAVFPGSAAAPAMSGVAAAGTGLAWSRSDHVHPSDTSRLALAGGTLSGALTLAADPAAALQPVTLQYLGNSTLDAGTF